MHVKRRVGAPTNSVAEDLKADGFARASTVHAELFRLKNGRAIWDKNTVVIVDEAAMLDTRVTRELLLEARRGGAGIGCGGHSPIRPRATSPSPNLSRMIRPT